MKKIVVDLSMTLRFFCFQFLYGMNVIDNVILKNNILFLKIGNFQNFKILNNCLKITSIQSLK